MSKRPDPLRSTPPRLFDRNTRQGLHQSLWRRAPNFAPPPCEDAPRGQGLAVVLALVALLAAGAAGVWLGVF